jgi:hypothetical protein
LSRTPRPTRLLLVALAIAAAGPAAAEVRLGVAAGAVELAADHLGVSVQLRNEGGTDTGAVDVDGEIFDGHSLARVPDGIPPGQAREVALRFPPDVPRPGTYALSLLLDYTPAGAATSPLSQRAYLLLALGEAAPPAVGIKLAETRLDWAGVASIGLESADGQEHRVRLRLEGPRGLRVVDPDGEIQVPAHGEVRTPIPVFRGTLPWDTVQGVLAVATSTDGPVARTTVVVGTARVTPDPAWLPRARKPLLFATLVLFGAVIFVEAWKRLA